MDGTGSFYLRAVLFDLDGTLVTGELDFDAIREEIGDVTGPILEHIESASPDDRLRATEILERHEEEAANRCRLNAGAEELLNFLRARGLHLGLLTRNSRTSVDHVCRRHKLYFDVIVSREDGPPKPSPEPVLTACRALGVDARQSLMVGDYKYDIQAGRAAGAWTALLCDRNRFLPDVEADFEIQTLTDLQQIVILLQEGRDAT
jgi:HAD superfamily hydrolase (TIGR01549 family)